MLEIAIKEYVQMLGQKGHTLDMPKKGVASPWEPYGIAL
jgi:hypothetical protein